MTYTNREIVTGLIVATILIVCLCALALFVMMRNLNYSHAEAMRLSNLKVAHANEVVSARMEMQELTYQMMAIEIHDNISLSIGHSIDALKELPPIHPVHDAAINLSLQCTSKALVDLAHLSRSLNPELIMRDGLLIFVEKEVVRLKSSGKYEVVFNRIGDDTSMESERELLIFRIIQECMNNFIKHAAAKKFSILLDYREDSLLVEVYDDGKGFIYPIPDTQARGAGMDNLENRIKVLHGKLSITTGPGLGTLIKMEIPYL